MGRITVEVGRFAAQWGHIDRATRKAAMTARKDNKLAVSPEGYRGSHARVPGGAFDLRQESTVVAGPRGCDTSPGGSNSPSPEGRSGAPSAGRTGGAGQPAEKDPSGQRPQLAAARWREMYETASEERAKWTRAFNRLEKAVLNHVKDRCIDSDDLAHVHKAILRDIGPEDSR